MAVGFRVREVRVAGTLKHWTDPRNQASGSSGGSEFELVVIPGAGQESWSPEEAGIVAFDVRMQIHTILLADAQKRGVPIPLNEQTSLIQYRQDVERLKRDFPRGAEWKDADLPPPRPVDSYPDRSGV